MVEKWRPVVEPGYEKHYDVSDLGQVRSAKTGRVLKPGVHPKGYRSLVLSVAGVRRSVLVHRLVLMAFIGPCPDGQEARHGDGVRSHNTLANLSWGTPTENAHDKRRHGTSGAGERNPSAKISDAQALDVLIRASQGESQRSIARAMGISQPQVSRIVTGKRRAPVPKDEGSA